MYQWFLWLHIAFSFLFYFAHGASLVVAFRLGVEPDRKAHEALLSVTSVTIPPMFAGFTGMGVFGIALGILSEAWRHGWWWLSILLMAGLYVWMTWYTRKIYSPIRKALGLPYMTGFITEHRAAETVESDLEVNRLIQKANPRLLMWVGLIVSLIELYLMTFKPF